MFFLTFDENSFPPYSTEGILIVSTVRVAGRLRRRPGRGRPFFLGAGLIGFWFTILQLTEKVFTAPFDLIGAFFFGSSESFDSTGSQIDPTTGEIIVGGGDFDSGGDFGVAPTSPTRPPSACCRSASASPSCSSARWLDKTAATAPPPRSPSPPSPASFVGVVGLAPDLEAAGTGLLMVAIGLALAYHGATVWRRATTWIGGGVTALGLAIFLGDMAGDDATTGGMLFIAGGIGLVFAGHLIADAIDEPDEMLVTLGVAAVARPARCAGSAARRRPRRAAGARRGRVGHRPPRPPPTTRRPAAATRRSRPPPHRRDEPAAFASRDRRQPGRAASRLARGRRQPRGGSTQPVGAAAGAGRLGAGVGLDEAAARVLGW